MQKTVDRGGEEKFVVRAEPGQMEFLLRISLVPITEGEQRPTEKRAMRNVSPRSTRAHETSVEVLKKEGTAQPESKTITHVKIHPPKTDQYLGKIGERGVFRLILRGTKVDRILTTTRYTHEFQEDVTGKRVIWVTYRDNRLVEGEAYNLKATIIKYYDRRGVKSTVLSRGKIVEG
jgi:hypothetical protein